MYGTFVVQGEPQGRSSPSEMLGMARLAYTMYYTVTFNESIAENLVTNANIPDH